MEHEIIEEGDTEIQQEAEPLHLINPPPESPQPKTLNPFTPHTFLVLSSFTAIYMLSIEEIEGLSNFHFSGFFVYFCSVLIIISNEIIKKMLMMNIDEKVWFVRGINNLIVYLLVMAFPFIMPDSDIDWLRGSVSGLSGLILFIFTLYQRRVNHNTYLAITRFVPFIAVFVFKTILEPKPEPWTHFGAMMLCVNNAVLHWCVSKISKVQFTKETMKYTICSCVLLLLPIPILIYFHQTEEGHYFGKDSRMWHVSVGMLVAGLNMDVIEEGSDKNK